MEGNDGGDFVSCRRSQNWLEWAGRKQLDVDVFRAGQKFQEQRATPSRRQVVRAAFARIASGDDERRRQQRNRRREQAIEAQFEKIGWPAHSMRPGQTPFFW